MSDLTHLPVTHSLTHLHSLSDQGWLVGFRLRPSLPSFLRSLTHSLIHSFTHSAVQPSTIHCSPRTALSPNPHSITLHTRRLSTDSPILHTLYLIPYCVSVLDLRIYKWVGLGWVDRQLTTASGRPPPCWQSRTNGRRNSAVHCSAAQRSAVQCNDAIRKRMYVQAVDVDVDDVTVEKRKTVEVAMTE